MFGVGPGIWNWPAEIAAGIWPAIVLVLLVVGLPAAMLWPRRARERTMRVPRVGDDVLYVLEDGPEDTRGQVRPAKIVRVWGTESTSACQLAVFVDGTNDYPDLDVSRTGAMPSVWRTSRLQAEDGKLGTFHYAEAPAGYPGAAISGEVTSP